MLAVAGLSVKASFVSTEQKLCMYLCVREQAFNVGLQSTNFRAPASMMNQKGLRAAPAARGVQSLSMLVGVPLQVLVTGKFVPSFENRFQS